MKVKHLLLASCLCGILISPTIGNITSLNTSENYTITKNVNVIDNSELFLRSANVIKSSTKNEKNFSITDTHLATRMMTLLGKSENKFSSNDLVNHENYKVIKEQIGTTGEGEDETPIYNTYANTTFLDLSNSNITNITELCQFVWPETLIGIDLSGNKITESNLTSIIDFTTLTSSSEDITYNESTIPVYGNIADILKVINLNLNNIDLTTLSGDNLNNSKIIYGIQKYSADVYNKDKMPSQYYIKDSDNIYINFSLEVNNVNTTLIKDSVTLFKVHGYGDYEIEVSSVEDAPIVDISKTLTQSYFNMYIKDTFSVERKKLFNITPSQIVVEGLNLGYSISASDPSTKEIGTKYVNITFTTSDKTWTTPLQFTVVDTISPTLKLKGGETIYLAVNGQNYIEYGCIGLDSDDDISHNIQITGKVDITKPGDYYITYNLKDDAGNSATAIQRKVVVQEYSLKSVIIGSLENEYNTNEEIILTANLPAGSDLSKYKKLKYTWYYNGQEFITTSGDDLTGKSSITLLETNTKNIKVYVVLTATLNDDSTESYVSDVMEINVKNNGKAVPSIIISILIALLIVIIVIVVVTIEKKKRSIHQKKSTKGTTKKTPANKQKDKKKSDSKSKGAYDNYDNIQVIKNYDNNNDDPPSTMLM